MLDTGSQIPYDNLGVMWGVQEAVNPEGVRPGDANKEWMSRGAQSLSAYLGMKNPANCMWAAGMGYQCLPETKGKLPKSAFKSNDSFISAVNKGSVPFKRVAKTNESDFDSKEKGLLRPGDIINFKGSNDTGDKNHPSTSHAMTFSHYREDGVPIYLDSNGEATDFNWNQGVWSGMKPNKKRTAYISRFDPEMFYKDKIETLEEAARNNPTYYKSGGASEQKIIFSPMEGGCPEGQYWTGTECKIIPKNTKIVYSEEELAKLNISKKEQQKLYNQYISRVKIHNTIEAAILKKYGKIGAKDKYYKTFESIPKHGFSPMMSYGTGQLIPNGLGPGIPSLRESMISFSQWKKMMDKSSVKPIGFKGHPGGGHFYPVYEKPSNYLLGYNKEEPVIPIDPVKEEVIDPVKETEVIDPTPTPTPTPDVPLVESVGIQDYPEELKGTDWEWDRKYHSFTTPRLNKHFPLGPLFNGKKKHNFSTPYLHRRKDYEDGGIIADFSTDQIQEYINGGYIVEEIDDYAEGGFLKRKKKQPQQMEPIEILSPEQEAFPLPETSQKELWYDPITLKEMTPEELNAYTKTYEEQLEKEKFEADKAAQPGYFDEAKNWVSNWHDSPMYNQMVLNSYNGQQQNADYVTKLRKKNIADLPPLTIMDEKAASNDSKVPDSSGVAAWSKSDTGQIEVFPDGYNYGPSLFTHEILHSSDRPRELYKWDHPAYSAEGYPDWMLYNDPRFPNEDVWHDRTMPKSDQMYITTHRGSNWKDNEAYKLNKAAGWYTPKTDEEIKKDMIENGFDPNEPEFNNIFESIKKQNKQEAKDYSNTDKKYWKEMGHDYVSDPTEVRARLGEIRFHAQKEDIYDPFTEQITPEIFQNYINKERDSENWQPLKPIDELRNEFTDEEILWMLQNISKNDNTSPQAEDELQYTKQGGSIGYQLGDEVDEATKRRLEKLGYVFEKIR